MISKELKKLNRRELVDVIYQLKKNEEQMQGQIASLEAELQDRRIHLSVAGSIAEAATDITGIFSVAQSAADLYLLEIAYMKVDTEIVQSVKVSMKFFLCIWSQLSNLCIF